MSNLNWYGFLLFVFAMETSLAAGEKPVAKQDSLTIEDTRAGLDGRWQGKLEYLDYQSSEWFGIPVTIEAELVDDGVTLIRKASFDDGNSGTVFITIVSMLSQDGKTESVGSFRADRPAELGTFSIRLEAAEEDSPRDALNWTIVAETEGSDDNRPARIRETTTRSGPNLVTLKSIDYLDDDEEEWLQRNRTVLKKIE